MSWRKPNHVGEEVISQSGRHTQLANEIKIIKYMNTRPKILRMAFVSVAIFGCSLTGFAASTNVNIIGSSIADYAFSPRTVTINKNDSVIWVWMSTSHSTTSTNVPPLWDSGIQVVPFSYTNQFTSSGNFGCRCVNHGFSGLVIVQSANVPPSVAITNPANGTVLAAPANVTIQASASDSDGTVTNVKFLVGSVILTNNSTAPFSAVTNNVAAGSYLLSAVASDNNGATATNSITINIVTPVPLTLGSITQASSTNFQFSYAANIGLSYLVQRSTNLAPANWITLVTNLAASNPVVFVDTSATNNPGFYRVGRLPNP
jgi:plastocyanin